MTTKINNLLERGTEADDVVVVLDWVLVLVGPIDVLVG
jgi:hypothetical protein